MILTILQDINVYYLKLDKITITFEAFKLDKEWIGTF